MALGIDLAGLDDVGPTLAEVSGRMGLAQALGRRLMTPAGGLFYDPDYGYDLRQHLNAVAPSVGSIASRVESECLKDERVVEASASVLFVDEELSIEITITDARGPFELVLSVTAFGVFLAAAAQQ